MKENDNKIIVMCELSSDDIYNLITYLQIEHIFGMLVETGITEKNIITAITFGEISLNIFNIDYLIVKYLPVIFSDFSVPFDVINYCVSELKNLVEEYDCFYPQEELKTFSEYSLYLSSKDMITEITEQWLTND